MHVYNMAPHLRLSSGSIVTGEQREYRAKGQGLPMTVSSEQDRDVAPMPVSKMAACTRPAKTQHAYKKRPQP